MIAGIITILYLTVGSTLGLYAGKKTDWGSPMDPEVYGLMLVVLLWLPVTLYAVWLGITDDTA